MFVELTGLAHRSVLIVVLQAMSADQSQLRSPLSPRNAGASLPLSPFRFPVSHASGIPLGARLRHCVG